MRSPPMARPSRALEGALEPHYEGSSGSTAANHGLPRFRSCAFAAAYPFGQVVLADPDVPLDVRIAAFNPLIPADAERSGIPVAILRFVLSTPPISRSPPQSAAACKTSSGWMAPPARRVVTSTASSAPRARRQSKGWRCLWRGRAAGGAGGAVRCCQRILDRIERIIALACPV
jgi:beta-glucosidase 2, glycosyl-hydrolase family 116 N-term